MKDWSSRIARARNLVFASDRAWADILEEKEPPAGIFLEYVLPMAAVPAAAHLLGFWYYGFFSTIFRAFLWLGLAVSGVWLTAKVIYYSSPHFNSITDEIRSYQLAAYSYTPFFAAGVAYIFPFLSLFVFLGGLYGVRLLSKGLPLLMETPADRQSGFVLAAGASMVAVMLLVAHLTGGIFWPSKP